VATEDKTLRGAPDRMLGKHAIHMVSAWASHNRLVLGPVKADENSNEIPAITERLQMLNIAGCIVISDARSWIIVH